MTNRADLLARIAIELESASKSNNSASKSNNKVPAGLKQLRGNCEEALRALKIDFEQSRNPVFAWEALRIAHSFSFNIPEWIRAYLGKAAAAMMVIRAEVEDRLPVGKEAARAGKALGFAAKGPGRGAWFKHATMLERDRAIHLEIRREFGSGSNVDYDRAARRFKVSRSVARRAYLRINRMDRAGRNQSS